MYMYEAFKKTKIVFATQRMSPGICKRMERGVAFFAIYRNWPLYDWEKLTTIVVSGDLASLDQEMISHAHASNTRVVVLRNPPFSSLLNKTAVMEWAIQVTQEVNAYGLDGVNIDTENEIAKGEEDLRVSLTESIKVLREELRSSANGNAQLTFDVAWSADCIDNRCYDYLGLSKVTDFFLVMAYDMRSQVYTYSCTAYANSIPSLMISGIDSFLSLGIDPQKLVVGLPWYGYKYDCIENTPGIPCPIEKVPFRGAPCSDAAGAEKDYGDISILSANATSIYFHSETQTPFFDIVRDGKSVQYWYDDSRSIGYKVSLLEDTKVRGVGVWHLGSLDYENITQVKRMWSAL
eukprot:CFRG7259T1